MSCCSDGRTKDFWNSEPYFESVQPFTSQNDSLHSKHRGHLLVTRVNAMEKLEIKTATMTQCFENYFHVLYLSVNKWSSCVFYVIKSYLRKGNWMSITEGFKLPNHSVKVTVWVIILVSFHKKKKNLDITILSSVDHLHVCICLLYVLVARLVVE